MTITALLSGLPNRTMDQATFDAAMANLMTDLPLFGQQANSLAASLNTIAAGGAYAIPYQFYEAGLFVGAAAGGFIGFSPNASSMSTATSLYVDVKDARGKDITALLDSLLAGSTSTIKGAFRVYNAADWTKWATFNVTAITSGVNGTVPYRYFTVACTGYSEGDPFNTGDQLLLDFQRTGDKGDTGATTSAKLSDRKTSNTTGGTATAADITQTRTINTTESSTIAGLSLSSNQITLPIGTYDIFASVPGMTVGKHKAFLYNVTDAAYAIAGSSEFSSNATSNQTNSIIVGRIVLAASKVFTIRHYTELAGSLGNAVACGQQETYTQINITKVA